MQIIKLLLAKGALVDYSDPFFPEFPPMREHSFSLRSLPVNQPTLASFDAVLLCTDHDRFDYELILRASSLLIDTRGRYPVESGVIRA